MGMRITFVVTGILAAVTVVAIIVMVGDIVGGRL